jgi:hypothetical protein
MVMKDENTDRLCLFVRLWQAAQWADHPHSPWGRIASACVADSLRCDRHLPGEKRKEISGLDIWRMAGGGKGHYVTHNCRTRKHASPLRAPRATTDTPVRGH